MALTISANWARFAWRKHAGAKKRPTPSGASCTHCPAVHAKFAQVPWGRGRHVSGPPALRVASMAYVGMNTPSHAVDAAPVEAEHPQKKDPEARTAPVDGVVVARHGVQVREEGVEPAAALEARPHAPRRRRVVAVHDDDDLDPIRRRLVGQTDVGYRAVALGRAVGVDALLGEGCFHCFDGGVQRGRVGGRGRSTGHDVVRARREESQQHSTVHAPCRELGHSAPARLGSDKNTRRRRQPRPEVRVPALDDRRRQGIGEVARARVCIALGALRRAAGVAAASFFLLAAQLGAESSHFVAHG
mmetsp:Transcript_21219/g.65354  ORF Transcript_21219/g.65354 Transcript_21219/m.65354 type:complete len:302 (-) Transcript_21219:195-1100(-)